MKHLLAPVTKVPGFDSLLGLYDSFINYVKGPALEENPQPKSTDVLDIPVATASLEACRGNPCLLPFISSLVSLGESTLQRLHTDVGEGAILERVIDRQQARALFLRMAAPWDMCPTNKPIHLQRAQFSEQEHQAFQYMIGLVAVIWAIFNRAACRQEHFSRGSYKFFGLKIYQFFKAYKVFLEETRFLGLGGGSLLRSYKRALERDPGKYQSSHYPLESQYQFGIDVCFGLDNESLPLLPSGHSHILCADIQFAVLENEEIKAKQYTFLKTEPHGITTWHDLSVHAWHFLQTAFESADLNLRREKDIPQYLQGLYREFCERFTLRDPDRKTLEVACYEKEQPMRKTVALSGISGMLVKMYDHMRRQAENGSQDVGEMHEQIERFQCRAKEWGVKYPTHSTGSELVLSEADLEQPASVLETELEEPPSKRTRF